ncbi:S8 family serine peptidase [Laspinema sp. D1]|uniref:S8 family serine peptidase n=1 Tax=Laspinema palackyanum D2a TaxID=2953684 RepID=A0ABT2MWT3_9CYAN|nr:S8 family serine peptidase [Laspinema sp. D2a]
MFELNHVSGTSNLLTGMMGDTSATDNILGLEPVQNWNPGSGGPTLDVSALNPGALTNLQGTVLPEETVQIALTTGTTDDIDPVTRESSTPVELTGEPGDRLFDAEYYAQLNPDLDAAGLNTLPQLFQHFKTHGLGEGRDFSLWTNLEYYAAQNPDLEAAGLTLHEQNYQHLQTFGLAEGREFSPWVDLQYYLDNNADLKAAFGEDTAKAFEHLQIFGVEEGRRFSPKLDLNYYLSHYSDLSAEFGDNKKLAFGHLQQFGVAEGRQFLPEIPEAATTESTEVESSAIDEQMQEGISIVFETQTTPTTSIPTASDVEEETNTSADLDTLPDESETAASVSIEVEEETIPDTSDEVEEETITETSDEVEEDEGNATASDDEVEVEQLSPTVTLSQTLMGLEEEPTPPLDLPENAGGANAKKNPAPKHLKLDATQEEYYQGGTVRLNGWIFDASGANDVERVEFSLHKTGEQWEEIENWTTFNISTKDDRWAYFDYSTFGLEPGKYQIKGFAYDSEGGKSNAAVAHFSVSAENPLPLVGVIDTGFNAKNRDIDYKRAALGTDFVDGDNNPLLEEGEGSEHGTHTLGIIGATQNNGVGIYGINDQAPLWLSRAIGSGKWGEALIEFVDYAIASEQPTAIANLSLDLTQVESDGNIKTRYEFTPKEREALEYARQNGILVVVAAGNDGSVMSVLGQASQEFDNIITVGATNGNQRADYSSYGRRGPDIMAEGGSSASPILSTAGEDVGTMAGTSIAAAQVTGVASLVWEANPELNYRQIIEALKSTATDLNIPGEDSETGAGLVNPDAAVEKAKQMTPEDYDPEDFLTPDTWGGEGLVTPEERAAEAFDHNGKWYDWELYTVQEGDNLSVIAQARTGDANDYWLIVNHPDNDIPDPNLIYPGEQYWVPVEVSAPVTEPEPTPDDGSWTPIEDPTVGEEPTPSGDALEWELYEVQDGDTLSDIAAARTGNSNDYWLIFNYSGNSGKIANPDEIYPGQQIWVPKGGSSSSGDSPSPVYAPTFEIYDLFKGSYDEDSEIGAPIGDPQISSSGFVSQEFESAYLIYNGLDVVFIEKKVEEIQVASIPYNELSLIRTGGSSSGKGNLIGGGGVEGLEAYLTIIANQENRQSELISFQEKYQHYISLKDWNNDVKLSSQIWEDLDINDWKPPLEEYRRNWVNERWDWEVGDAWRIFNTKSEGTIDDNADPNLQKLYEDLTKRILGNSGEDYKPNIGYVIDIGYESYEAAYGLHDGIDIDVPDVSRGHQETEVKALVGGKIRELVYPDKNKIGYSLEIAGDDGRFYHYIHLSSLNITSGERVQPGQIIGRVGDNTKYPLSNHLHYQVNESNITDEYGAYNIHDDEEVYQYTENPLKAFWELMWYGI